MFLRAFTYGFAKSSRTGKGRGAGTRLENTEKTKNTRETNQEHRALGITAHSSQSLFEIAFRNHCSR